MGGKVRIYVELLWQGSPRVFHLFAVILNIALFKGKKGIYDDYPLCYMKDNVPKGLYVDILKYVASKEKWNVTFIYDKWEKLLDMLKNEEIDALAAIAYTNRKRKNIGFRQGTFYPQLGRRSGKKTSE